MLTGDEMALAHGGGAFGDDVMPYRPRGPVRGQTSPDSSLAASCRMVHNSVTGTDIPEPMWRTAARVDETGGRLSDATKALRVSNVPAALHEGMALGDLELATTRGPAIVSGRGHALLVDTIEDGMVRVRDPGPSGVGSAYAVPVARFGVWWSGSAVVADDGIRAGR